MCFAPERRKRMRCARRCTPPARKSKRWVRSVKTVSTFPPAGLFTKDARTIARTMATRRVSPKGIASGIRMIQFFINRGGKGLSPGRRRELERAKRMLQARLDRS